MRSLLQAQFISFLLLAAACAEATEEIPDGFYRLGDPNTQLARFLGEDRLKFERVAPGLEIPLHSVIAMPRDRGDSMLVMEFRRSDLRKAFVRGLFFGEDMDVVKGHPFAGAGIEPILTDKRLIVKIHWGVTLHLRDGMEYFPNYKTFVTDNVTAKITEAHGDVFYSSDQEIIKTKLKDFYGLAFAGTMRELMARPDVKVTQTPEGDYDIVGPPDMFKVRERYPPKVVEGP